MGYLEEGMEYNADGDIVDKRSSLLDAARAEVRKRHAQARHEEKLREKYPAVKEAWNQYQTVIKLVDDA